MNKLQIENGEYTRIHNEILEALSRAPLSGLEMRAVLFLLRKTYGWNKKEDAISLSQWSTGLGLKFRHHAMRVVYSLVQKNIFYQKKSGSKTRVYGFNKYYEKWLFEDVTQEGVTKNGVTLQGSTAQGNKGVNLQGNKGVTLQVNNKRQLKTIKDKSGTKSRDPLLDNDAVKLYRGICKLTANEIQRKHIAENVVDIKVWEKVLLNWMKSGYNARNVAGQVDAYLKVAPPRNRNREQKTETIILPGGHETEATV